MQENTPEKLQLIKSAVKQRNILWTYHVFMRMQDRSIPRSSILDSADTFEIVESYPDDKYMPSCLVRAESEEGIIHILFALDVRDGFVRVITAYRPDIALWSPDGRLRL
ncbi:MAG: DUF4258 domain-containing protein [Aminivibrio sp.]